MDERVFVIAEGLKGMNNAAIDMVMKGKYDEAEKMFESAESTCRLFQYNEGIGMIRVSLANLYVMRGDLLGALTNIEIATRCYPHCKERDEARILHQKIAVMALGVGIEKENAGDLNGALEIFERILPNLNEKRAVLVAKEIDNIKEHLRAEGERCEGGRWGT
jgi:tetratricopeptide (TPR) repeat protein